MRKMLTIYLRVEYKWVSNFYGIFRISRSSSMFKFLYLGNNKVQFYQRYCRVWNRFYQLMITTTSDVSKVWATADWLVVGHAVYSATSNLSRAHDVFES